MKQIGLFLTISIVTSSEAETNIRGATDKGYMAWMPTAEVFACKWSSAFIKH